GESIFFTRIHREVILARASRIDKFELDVFADSLQMAVPPLFPSVCGRRAATFLERAIIGAPGSMGFDFVRRAPKNIDVAAVGAPARYARREVLVRVGDPAVVFFFKAILIGFGIGIPEIKQGLDELVALFVGTKAQKSLAFLLCDDVDEVFVEYTPVGGTYLSP